MIIILKIEEITEIGGGLLMSFIIFVDKFNFKEIGFYYELSILSIKGCVEEFNNLELTLADILFYMLKFLYI